MIFNETLIVPYVMSDLASRIAVVKVNDLFKRMSFNHEE